MSDSPFDRFDEGPIEAQIVDQRGDEPRLLGYRLIGDLAANYELHELFALLLGGRFATPAQAEALHLALVAAMDVSIADGAVHAARLARHLAFPAGNEGSVVTVAAIGAAEMARYEVDTHAELLAWLESDRSKPLPSIAAGGGGDAVVELIHAQVEPAELGLQGLFEQEPSRRALTIALLWAAGLREPHELMSLLVTARLPGLMAEAFGVEDPELWAYPLNLPFWDYHADSEE